MVREVNQRERETRGYSRLMALKKSIDGMDFDLVETARKVVREEEFSALSNHACVKMRFFLLSDLVLLTLDLPNGRYFFIDKLRLETVLVRDMSSSSGMFTYLEFILIYHIQMRTMRSNY